MKKNQKVFRMVLLSALTVFFFNCKKSDTPVILPTLDYSTFMDARDGKTYKTVKIGNLEWMSENLSFKTASGSWYYDDADINGAKFGRLYTLEAAELAVPEGWHLPTDLEWKQLEISLGMSSTEADGVDFRGTNEGTKLKTTSGWPENGNGTDEVHLTVLPGGFRSNAGGYLVLNWYAYFWTSTEVDTNTAWVRTISYNNTKIGRIKSFKGDGYSVRCIKN